MAHRHEWLHEQVGQWLKEGLLEQSAADEITSRYPLSASGSWLKYAITAFGAVIFGLGIILAFAYNWAAMPKLLKLAVIFAGIALAHGLAFRYSRRQDSHQGTVGIRSFFRSHISNLAEGFHLLGSMLFGAGIFLIAQIYHLDEHFPTAFLLWGIGALAMAWILPSNFQALLALVPLAIWGGSELLVFKGVFWPAPLLLFAGLVVFAWIRQSVFLFAVSLATTIWLAISNVLFVIDDDYLMPLLYLLGIVLIVSSLLTSRSEFFAGSNLLFKFGALVYGGFLFYLSSARDFGRYLYTVATDGNAAIYHSLYLMPVVLSMAVLIFVLTRKVHTSSTMITADTKPYMVSQCILLSVSSVVIYLYGTGREWLDTDWLTWIFSIILFVHGVLLIIHGNVVNRRTLLLYGSGLVLLITTTRFLDLFYSLLARSLVFLIVGGMLFYIGHRISRMPAVNADRKNTDPADAQPITEKQNA